MLEFGACPRCKLDISEQRRKQVPTICNHCGFSGSDKVEKHSVAGERNVIKVFSTLAILFVASYIQLANWDNHSLDIIPLKIKEATGTLSTADNEQYAQICMELKKWDCVETEYSLVAKQDPNQILRLANFQMKRAKYNEAAQTFYSFFQNGGNDLEASYSYAKALAQLGQVDEATKYFDQVLAARPDVLQVTVVQNYVKLLMDHQRYDQAKKLIVDIRKLGPTADMFMETEFKHIKEMTTASRD